MPKLMHFFFLFSFLLPGPLLADPTPGPIELARGQAACEVALTSAKTATIERVFVTDPEKKVQETALFFSYLLEKVTERVHSTLSKPDHEFKDLSSRDDANAIVETLNQALALLQPGGIRVRVALDSIAQNPFNPDSQLIDFVEEPEPTLVVHTSLIEAYPGAPEFWEGELVRVFRRISNQTRKSFVGHPIEASMDETSIRHRYWELFDPEEIKRDPRIFRSFLVFENQNSPHPGAKLHFESMVPTWLGLSPLFQFYLEEIYAKINGADKVEDLTAANTQIQELFQQVESIIQSKKADETARAEIFTLETGLFGMIARLDSLKAKKIGDQAFQDNVIAMRSKMQTNLFALRKVINESKLRVPQDFSQTQSYLQTLQIPDLLFQNNFTDEHEIKALKFDFAAWKKEKGKNTPVRVRLSTYHSDHIMIEGALVTGDEFYPTDLILKNLGLTPERLAELHGKAVVSVAEGFSGLLPKLLEAGAQAKAVDLWYGMKDLPKTPISKKMLDFNDKHSAHLLPGDATHLPLPDGSQAAVFSHMLVLNLNWANAVKSVEESIRVLAPGGEARIVGFDMQNREAVERELARFASSMGIRFTVTEIKENYSRDCQDNLLNCLSILINKP